MKPRHQRNLSLKLQEMKRIAALTDAQLTQSQDLMDQIHEEQALCKAIDGVIDRDPSRIDAVGVIDMGISVAIQNRLLDDLDVVMGYVPGSGDGMKLFGATLMGNHRRNR